VLALLAVDVSRAEEQLALAGPLVNADGSQAARAETLRAQGRLRHAQGQHDDALLLLRQALASYEAQGRHLEATRTQLDLARVLAAAQVPQRMVVRAYQDAASRAEACRNDELIELIDQELECIDEEAFWRHAFERTRSTAAPLFKGSLHRGTSEVGSILCLELADFEPFCRGLQPEAVLRTLNQLLADFEEVIHRHRGHITSYPGAGLVALLREAGHADRAVLAALDLRAVVADFNQPRAILGLPLLPARIGVASGAVFLGNIGTYRYLCFTAVGAVPNLAGHITHRADPTTPAISQETYEQVRDRFVYRPDGPRLVEVAGVGTVRVWDVTGRNRTGRGGTSGRLSGRPTSPPPERG
jgi:class 3 adenylate cyclase